MSGQMCLTLGTGPYSPSAVQVFAVGDAHFAGSDESLGRDLCFTMTASCMEKYGWACLSVNCVIDGNANGRAWGEALKSDTIYGVETEGDTRCFRCLVGSGKYSLRCHFVEVLIYQKEAENWSETPSQCCLRQSKVDVVTHLVPISVTSKPCQLQGVYLCSPCLPPTRRIPSFPKL